jgi:integrase
MKDIRKGHMQDILDSISHMGGTSQARLKYVMQQTFKWALENDIVTKDYSQFLTTDVKQKEEAMHFPFTTEEIKKLWSYQNKLFPFSYGKKGGTHETTAQTANAMLVLIYTGMRVMELGELKAADVHLDERYIDLQGTKTKSAKRIVPIHKDIVPVVEALLADGGEYLVVNGHGLPITYPQWKVQVIARVNDVIGTKHTLHDTRHTFISAAERSGLDANSIILKRIVGHSTGGNTTAIYTHKNIDDLLAAIDKIKLI